MIPQLRSWLDTLLYGYRIVQFGGAAQPARDTINFLGSCTVVDNPTTGATDVTIATAAPTDTFALIKVGVGPFATAGTVRLAQDAGAGLFFRNTGNTGNLCGVAASGNNILLGDANAGTTSVSALGTVELDAPSIDLGGLAIFGDVSEVGCTADPNCITIDGGASTLTLHAPGSTSPSVAIDQIAGTVTLDAGGGTTVTMHAASGVNVPGGFLAPATWQFSAPQLLWQAAAASPSIGQAAATSGAGQTLAVSAQAGFAGSAGGVLFIGGGGAGTPGTTLAGATQVNLGAPVSGASAKASFLVSLSSVLDISQSAASTTTLAVPNANDLALAVASGAFSVRLGGAATLGLTSSTLSLLAPGILWGAGVASPSIKQTQATSGAGQSLVVLAQQGFAGSVGGILFLGGGTGGTPGTNLAGDTQISLGAPVSNVSAKASFLVSLSSILDISQTATTTTSIDAGTNALILNGGSVTLKVAGTQRWSANGTGIGLYTATPVAQASRVGQLTNSTTGTPSTTIGDVGGSFSQTTLNNINASLLAKINALELVLHNLGATA